MRVCGGGEGEGLGVLGGYVNLVNDHEGAGAITNLANALDGMDGCMWSY